MYQDNSALAKQNWPAPLLTGHSPGPCVGNQGCHQSCPHSSGKCCWTCSAHSRSSTRWAPPPCKLCKLETGSLSHELMSCTLNENIGQLLLTTLQTIVPSLTSANILHLEFSTMDTKLHLPATLLTAVTLSTIWKDRTTNSRVRAYQVRS